MIENFDPKKVRHIHLIAICGTGMGSLAGMLKDSGFEVSGSDHNAYPPMSTYLEGLGINPKVGFSPSHLNPRPDLVVIGNAVPKTNPEVQEVLNKQIPYLSLPQALATFFLDGKKNVVITGTHGKTTTSALMAWILEFAGLNPGCMIGGWALNFNGNNQLGGGQYFVVEGDEYDTAFFDKGPKFLHYKPTIGVITSIEFDHGDIYKDLNSIKAAFKKFIDLLPPDGFLVAAQGDPNIDDILKPVSCKVERYGLESNADWWADGIKYRKGGIHFELRYKGQPQGDFEVPVVGLHNLKNVLAVIAVSQRIGLPLEKVKEGLTQFRGVKRRQEVVGEVREILVLDDFAHHPTAIQETLTGLKNSHPHRRLWAVFEPRSATSRKNIFQKEFVNAFRSADCVVIADLFSPEKIPPEERLDPKKLVEDIEKSGKRAWFLPQTGEILHEMVSQLQPGDLVCIMSSGSFDGLHKKLIQVLEEHFS
ncbi:MAG TPA: UDP-N-acetylmuramate:L-alanyl-gamma-D-glutamyl-meso-diaminopimelate ligase [Nitrospiria bacterium]